MIPSKPSPRERIAQYRLQQPVEELERKAVKARRKALLTQEDIDVADVRAATLLIWMEGGFEHAIVSSLHTGSKPSDARKYMPSSTPCQPYSPK